MIRVLLIDDHPVVRSGYRRLLEQEGDITVVAECGDADSGYQAFVREQPAVCITDLSLPGASGLDGLRRMRARCPEACVLVFSMHDSAHVVRRALDEGARGFVSKNADPESLVAAVRALREGRRYLSPDLSPRLLQAHHQVDERLASLSPREFSVFRLLAEGRSASECADALNLSPKTVANVQTLVKEKLQVSTSAALVHLALQLGMIVQPEVLSKSF
ncbi:MAG: response regulator transcription factor [Curvibacter sp.]|nr:response regulator transcription factor [Curvibacter sp.]